MGQPVNITMSDIKSLVLLISSATDEPINDDWILLPGTFGRVHFQFKGVSGLCYFTNLVLKINQIFNPIALTIVYSFGLSVCNRVKANSVGTDQTSHLWHLVWVNTVCQCLFYRYPGTNGLMGHLTQHPHSYLYTVSAPDKKE